MLEVKSSSTRLLAAALGVTFVLHGLSMLGMAIVLLPMMPGGGTHDDAVRIALIAAHPWRFRLGWLPWHLTAASDLFLAFAMIRTAWISRAGAFAVAAITCLAVALDQLAQFAWITHGIDLARDAVSSGNLTNYLAFEAWAFPLTGMWAAMTYTLAAVAWSICFAKAKVWNGGLTVLSWILWPLFFAITIGPVAHVPISSEVVAAGNAIGFLLMQLWFLGVLECVLRVERPDSSHGRYAPWKHPRTGIASKCVEWIANSRAARWFAETLPVVEFASDIRDVVYANFLVPAEKLEPFVPAGLSLQRLGPNGKWAAFTFLTYRHGNFGPRGLGPLRKLFPSPVQSNWRIYVSDPSGVVRGIYFVTNTISTAIHALGARVMAEGLPMHLMAAGLVESLEDGGAIVRVDPGRGSAPDVEITARASTRPEALEAPWNECFDSYRAYLEYIVPQDRAMSTQPWYGVFTSQEIDLGIPTEACEHLDAKVVSNAAREITAEAAPLCFRVPRVSFRFSQEIRRGLFAPRDAK